MNRPPFYPGTTPDAWLRTPRNAFDPAAYADPIERPEPDDKAGRTAARICIGIVALMAVLFVAHVAARLL